MSRIISIHAPRTGSDGLLRRGDVAVPIFQSTLPARGATRHGRGDAGRVVISIHAPRTGSDAGYHPFPSSIYISIHAPRTGSDGVKWRCWLRYPISIHAPRTGSDTRGRIWHSAPLTFQSTLPARGATQVGKIFCHDCLFQSTLPARGATAHDGRGAYAVCYFNPRSPHGERPTTAYA